MGIPDEGMSRHRIANFSACFLVVFLVLFPKGGIKLGNLPLTWGYLFLALSIVPVSVVRLVGLPLRFRRAQVGALGMLAPFQILFVYTYLTWGILDLSFTFSTFVGLFILPWVFLLLYSPFLPFIDGKLLSNYFRGCILVAAVWGIFLFFWHPLTGHYVEIPYLTVNADDYGQLEQTKHIARGLFFKLISTYNNGNLYGVATLMLLPLYEVFEPLRWRRAVVKVALLLTLSRSVWFGMIFNELLPLIAQLGRNAKSFPVMRLGRAGKGFLALAVTGGLILLSLLFNGSNLAFLFDPTGGGRLSKIVGAASDITFLPSRPLYGFDEVLYASALQYFGVTGLFAFTLIMVSPILLLAVDRSALASPTRRAALRGLILYMFLAGLDGGFSYIPVTAFYWFVYMTYIFGWPKAFAAVPKRQGTEVSSVPGAGVVPAAGMLQGESAMGLDGARV